MFFLFSSSIFRERIVWFYVSHMKMICGSCAPLNAWMLEDFVSFVPSLLDRLDQPGHFFYRVCNPKGVCLYTKADAKSKLHGEIIGRGAVIEASEKYTPAGSPVSK